MKWLLPFQGASPQEIFTFRGDIVRATGATDFLFAWMYQLIQTSKGVNNLSLGVTGKPPSLNKPRCNGF